MWIFHFPAPVTSGENAIGMVIALVMRGNLGWIETNNFDKVPPDLRFFAGGDGSIGVTVTTKSHRKMLTAN